ncbi:MAG: 1,4-alpha-glucan branching protein GlgB [Myxococcota bacterium]
MYVTVEQHDLYRIIYTDHPDPFSVLGAHEVQTPEGPRLAVRAFMPDDSEVFVLEQRPEGELRHRMTMVHPYGFFELLLPDRSREGFQYWLERVDEFGHRAKFQDSFAFPPDTTEFDLHLFGQGRNLRIFEKLGAHKATLQGVGGIRFAVWAPAARSVSVVGNFNGWDRRKHPMRRMTCGVWEIFVPGLEEGTVYQYQLRTHQDTLLDKADPYATRSQTAPKTASIVHALGRYRWNDDDWMATRAQQNPRAEAMSIYEVHLGSWRRQWDPMLKEERPLSYRDLITTLVPYVKSMGFTHVEFLPVMEHPFGGSWGYQVTGFYAPNSRLGRPEELMALIDAFHQEGIGVILDWVPAHFPKDAHALGRFDGTAVFEHLDPRKGEHPEWGTYIFNYGRNEVRNFLLGSALFWLENYHADGLRVDAITSMLYLSYGRRQGEWVPNKFGGPENLEAVEFIKELTELVQKQHPGRMVIAEESTSWPGVTRPEHLGGLGFDFKWNMGWMNDTLAYMSTDPIHRKFQHQKLTFSIWYAFSEHFILPLSHDEVVHLKRALISKMPGNQVLQAANLRLLLGYQFGHPGKKLLFMGGELGQWREWNHDRGLDWFVLNAPLHQGLQRYVAELNAVYRAQPALWQLDGSSEGFEWVDFADSTRSIIVFLRKGNDPRRETLLLVYNFTPVPRYQYRVGVDESGVWEELFNSDAEVYGGSNVGNYGQVEATSTPFHNRRNSLLLNLPPLGLLILKRRIPAALDFDAVIGAAPAAEEPVEQLAEASTPEATAPTGAAAMALGDEGSSIAEQNATANQQAASSMNEAITEAGVELALERAEAVTEAASGVTGAGAGEAGEAGAGEAGAGEAGAGEAQEAAPSAASASTPPKSRRSPRKRA